MKKILILLAVLWTAPAFAQVSNTVNPPACGSTSVNNSAGCANFGNSLYTFLAAEDANRWAEQGFGNAVSEVANANACLGSTSAGLTMTPTSCVAYNDGYRSTETGSITFPDASTCWISMDYNTSGSNAGLPASTRVAGTHYLRDCSSGSAPSEPANAQLLMEVVTSGGAITAVTDLRVPFLNLSFLSTATAGNFAAATSANIVQAEEVLIGGINPSTEEFGEYGSYNNDTIESGVAIPSGASPGTGTGNTTTFGSYITNQAHGWTAGGGTNAVGFYSLGIDDANNAATWGINTTIADPPSNVFTNMLMQNEFDFNVNNTGDFIRGLLFTGSSTATPADAKAIWIQSLDNNLGTQLHPWQYALVIGPGASTNGIAIQQQPGSGPQSSQPMSWQGFDGTNPNVALETADADGGFHILPANAGSGYLDTPNSGVFGPHALIWNHGIFVGNTGSSDLGTGTVDTPAAGGYYRAGNSAVEFNLTTSGALGGLTSTAGLEQACDITVQSGHFTNLVIVTDLNGASCSTAPTFNVEDVTSSVSGTQKAGSTSAGAVGQAQTISFAAGDTICITRTVNGGTCTSPVFTVTAHMKEP